LIKKISTEYNLKIKEKDERINTLEAEYEDMDREFKKSKESTEEEIEKS